MSMNCSVQPANFAMRFQTLCSGHGDLIKPFFNHHPDFITLFSQFIDWANDFKHDNVLWHLLNGGSSSELCLLTSDQLSGNSPMPTDISQGLRTAVQNTKPEDWEQISIAIKKLNLMLVFDLCHNLRSLELPVATDFALDIVRITRLEKCTKMVLGHDSDSD